ncbi:MAG: hypothetical protein ABI968_10095 [Acidobacteriota bacterium]
MNRYTRLAAAALLFSAPLCARAEQPAPILRLPGLPDRAIDNAFLRSHHPMDIRLEDTHGNIEIYHGLPLLEVLEKSGYDIRSMAAERKSSTAVVLITARDGYAAAFSIGELRMHRRDPKVFLVGEGPDGPLPENEGPVRLIVYGDNVRSPYGLARIELKALAENPHP